MEDQEVGISDGDTKASMWIHPLSIRELPTDDADDESQSNKPASRNGSYQVIQLLVTASPNLCLPEAEIETLLETYTTPTGEFLWRRVAVWSGPTTNRRVLHASFILPHNNNDSGPTVESLQTSDDAPLHEQPSLVCWAAFPERPHHKLLCVLVNPSTLTIWDVYPSNDDDDRTPETDKVYVSAEGHSVSLPFQCNKIHPLGDAQGILLERKEDQEDLDARKVAEACQTMDISHPELDEFFLKVPPRNTRVSAGGVGSDNHNHDNPASTPQTPHHLATPRTAYTVAPVEVSSLFSLKHPLEDVLPVSLLSQDNSNDDSLVTDVFEKVLYSSNLKWTDDQDHYLSKQEYQQPICVTYNTILKRHAIWAIKGAPPPATEPPLWQRSRNLRSNKETYNGMLDQDMEDMELLGIADPALHQGPTRDEALADALGVRRTPRKPPMMMEPRSRNHRPEAASVNRSGFLQRSMRVDGSVLDTTADVSMLDTAVANPQQLLNLRPLNNLHPSVAIECLYEESKESAPATNVFLTSNSQASGLLVVGLVCPSSQEQAVPHNPNSLRLLAVEPSLREGMSQDDKAAMGTMSESLLHQFTVTPLFSMDCIAAQPVQSMAVPLCFRPHSNRTSLSTEVLVLKGKADSNTSMGLYRSLCLLTDCALLGNTSGIQDIKHSVRGTVNFVTQEGIQVRGRVSLTIESHAMAENVLAAIESTFLGKGGANQGEFALKFRADCCRLEQALRRDKMGSCKGADPGWLAIATLLDAVVDSVVYGARPDASKAKKERNSVAVDRSPWEALLGSSFHADFSLDHEDALFMGKQACFTGTPSTKLDRAAIDPSDLLLSSIGPSVFDCLRSDTPAVLSSLFETLHLVYEDFKLSSDSSRINHLRCVGSFLVKTCFKFLRSNTSPLLQDFISHYKSDLGSECLTKLKSHVERKSTQAMDTLAVLPTSWESPPSILKWLDALIKRSPCRSAYDTTNLSTINAVCTRTRSLLRIFRVLFQQDGTTRKRDYSIVSMLCQQGFQTANEVRDELSPGVALPILEALNRCSDNPHEGDVTKWTAAEFALIGRQDLGCNEGFILLNASTRRKANKSVVVRSGDKENPSFVDKDKDGLVPLQVSSAMLFPADNRIKEAGRLLRSSTPCFLSAPRAIEVSDHEYERLKQNKLLLLCRRTLALSVGRGMLTIGSFQPVAAEPLPIPDLCMVGRVPPTNASLALDMSECQSGFRIWPEFHNGCAAGLRLPLAGETSESISKITRTWIVYNRPTSHSDSQPQNQTQPPGQQNQNHAHGGLLLALGLRGHLAALEMTDIYDLLTQGQVTLTCGVLLGMAASKRGSCDISVSKMLCLHLPSLIPQHFSAIDVASPVQTAAVTGAGLLFQGSSHRMMTEFLLNEIGRRPESDVTLDREAYTLSCGIALGMVNICKGDRVAKGGEGLDDLQIAERLYRYIVGGTDEGELHRTRENNDRQNLPTTSSSSENERCSCVFEGDTINIDVTAAGATLALGLIFLRSGNQNIASAIALPDTHFLLEYVRPDFLALRVISKALILWDTVLPSKDWIGLQLPRVVRDAYQQMKAKMKTATDLGDILESDEEEIGSLMEADDDATTRREVHFMQDGTRTRARTPHSQDYDCQAVRQIYVHVVAGACFALGLRFAGTGDKRAAAAIFERVVELQTLRDASDSVSLAMRPEPQILETCLGTCAISLALVQAGSGNIDSLKLFKILRWRCDEQVKFGTHMSYGIAIGLLFLGGGTCTLDRTPEAIAALLAAFFPRFPFTTTDNQYHLQALRHLYALAVKRRDIQFVDVDTEEIVSIPIQIKFRDCASEPLCLTTPCLFPNADGEAVEARIISDRYYPLKLELGKASFGRTFFVKRRAECPYSNGGIGTMDSLLVQSGSFQGGDFADHIKSLFGSSYIQAFANYMCVRAPPNGSQHGVSIEAFCKSVLHECLMGCSELALPIYLRLRASIALIESKSSSSALFAWDFRFFYGQKYQLLNVEKIAYLVESVERVCENLESRDHGCLHILRA